MQLLFDKRIYLSDSVVYIPPNYNSFKLFLLFIYSRLARSFWIDRFPSVILFVVVLLFFAAIRLKGPFNFCNTSICTRISTCGLITGSSHLRIWVSWIRLWL
jgi:hypothetical protein